MRILVTGATGGLGRNAVEYLLRTGHQVIATGRNTAVGQALTEQGADFVALDLATAHMDTLRRLVGDVDAVWHCAALSSPWGAEADFIACNIDATKKMLTVAEAAGVKRFIHISTPALYFDYHDRYDIKEDFRAAKFVNLYAQTKAEAEELVHAAVARGTDMKIVMLRPRAIFGPYDQVLIPRLMRVLKERNGRLPLPRAGQAVFDMTYVDNVVHAMWLATNRENIRSGSVYNITNGEPRAIGDVLRQLFVQELGQKFEVAEVPYVLMMATARACEIAAEMTGNEPQLTRYSVGALAYNMTLNIERARQELHYEPYVGMDEGIRRTAAWIRSNG